MADFGKCFDIVLGLEGGYVLHKVKGDRGGLTYAGISLRAWPNWAGWKKIESEVFDSELKEMVKAFYKAQFWDVIKGDAIASQDSAYHVFDSAVNMGLKTAVKMCQKALKVTADGVFGPGTIKALNDYTKTPDQEKIFVLKYCLKKVFRYKEICEADRRKADDMLISNIKFLVGWLNRVERGLE